MPQTRETLEKENATLKSTIAKQEEAIRLMREDIREIWRELVLLTITI